MCFPAFSLLFRPAFSGRWIECDSCGSRSIFAAVCGVFVAVSGSYERREGE